MEIKNLFATLLESVTISHKLHLETKTYSTHKALDEYYTDFPDIVDALVETYQGKYDVVEEGDNEVEKTDPIEYFENLYKYTKSAYDLFDEDDDTEIISCMDDVCGKIDQTLYQLKKLNKIKEGRKMKTLSNFITESLSLNEAASKWTLNSAGKPEMYRFTGKTSPSVYYIEDKKIITCRDNNGRNPSPSYTTDDISVEGLNILMQRYISNPRPTVEDMEEFISRIK